MRKLRHLFTTALVALTLLLWGNVGWGQIISQYVETNSGTFPKGVEIWNNTEATLDFATNNLDIQKGNNGGALTSDALVIAGQLLPNAVMVIGTADMGTYLTAQGLTGVMFVEKEFTFNGDDALAVIYGGTTTDVFGTPGTDPGSAWTGSEVSTANQNIQLLSGITTGNIIGWTDPSLRFETVSITPVSDLTGFGLAPEALPADTDPPVPTFSPANAATDVAIGVNPTITFDEAIYTSPAGVAVVDGDLAGLINFTFNGVPPKADVTFTATITGNAITIVPSADLSNEGNYTITIATVQDAAGNAMTAPASATFTTISAAAQTIELTGTYTGPYYAGEDVTVTWSSANISNVMVEAWVPSENEGAGGWVVMVVSTPAVDGTATFTIPADAEYSANYKLRVANTDGGTPFAETGTFEVIPTVTIHQIQSEANVDGNSNYVDDFVRTGGRVSAVKAADNFFLQAGEGAYTGINVSNAGHGLAVGDSITIVAKVRESFGMTQLFSVVGITNHSNEPLWAAATIATGDLGEMYEGVLVTVENAEVISANQYGELIINDGSGEAMSDDAIYSYVVPEVGRIIGSLTGVVDYSYSNFKILPRDANDFNLLSNDATLSTFTLGGINVLGLDGLIVTDPLTEVGATLFVTDFTGFAGIVATVTDATSAVVITLNGTVVDEADYATQELVDGDVIVATVTAEDATTAYYKVTISGENRELSLTAPVGVNNYNTGDDIVFTWTSANIANVNLYAVDAVKAVNLINEEGIIDATLGTYTYTVANGIFGSYTFRIADATDATIFDETVETSTITDNMAPTAEVFYPAFGAVGVPTSFTLSVKFNENVKIATGNLTIHKASDNAVVATITQAEATATNDVVTAAITGLAWETAYYVNVTAGMIQDLAGNDVPAISDNTTWTFTTIAQPASDLFFSEYIEGSSNNKALEIYNPTSAPIDLSVYEVRQFSNGSSVFNNSLVLTGTLAVGDVYVIANANAVGEILDVADVTSNVTFYNGNDAIGLYKNGVLIDIIGTNALAEPLSSFPSFDVAGVTAAALDHTLVRKASVIAGNTNWAASAGTNADDSEWVVHPKDEFSFLGWHGFNNEAEILSFGVDEQMAAAIIDPVAATITLEVLNGTDLATLVPEFTLSTGATATANAVEQESGVSVVDFTNPVVYTVEAESGITKDWTVTITEAAVSTQAEILSFSLVEQIGPATINSGTGTIDITVAPGTEVTALVPTIEVSLGATISPLSDVAQDFTNAVVYTVTAQDGTTTKAWTVTVTISSIIPIYDIQFTPAPSGESPYKDQVVTTKGIVTAKHYNYEGGVFKGLFIQDGEGAWNGLYVFNEFMENIPNVGDEIIISGMIQEYYTLTELTTASGTVPMTITVLSTDNELPAPTVLTTVEAAKEPWEGVLISVKNAEYTVAADSYNVFGVNDGSGVVYVDDDMYDYAGVFEMGKRYDITGIGHFSFDYAKILPRFASDVELVSSVGTVWGESISAYPNPFTNTLTIDNIENASRVVIVNLIGQQVMSINLNGVNRKEISTSELATGVYLVTIVNNQGQKAVRKMIKR